MTVFVQLVHLTLKTEKLPLKYYKSAEGKANQFITLS